MTTVLTNDSARPETAGAQPPGNAGSSRSAWAVALVGALLLAALAWIYIVSGSEGGTDLGETPLAASGDEVLDDTAERMAVEQLDTLESSLGDAIVLHQGDDPTFGEWFVSIRPSASGLEGGFCTMSNSGGGCRVDPDLDRFGLMFLDGRPVPVVGWGAPAGIEGVRVWWEDGRVEDVAVAHIPGESWGLAATIMPAPGAGFSYAALDAGGNVVVERQQRPIIPDDGTHP